MDLPGSVMTSLKVRLDSTTLLDVNAGLRVADQTRLGTETTTSWYRRCYLLVGPSGKSASPWMVSRAGVVVLLSNLLQMSLITGRVVLQLTVIMRDLTHLTPRLVFAGFIAMTCNALLLIWS